MTPASRLPPLLLAGPLAPRPQQLSAGKGDRGGPEVTSQPVPLSLLGQAICTEAAAREIGAGRSEQKRREQAQKDLLAMKADLNAAMEKKAGTQPFFEKKPEEQAEEDEDMLPAAVSHHDEPAPRRRRRENPLTLIRSEQTK